MEENLMNEENNSTDMQPLLNGYACMEVAGLESMVDYEPSTIKEQLQGSN